MGRLDPRTKITVSIIYTDNTSKNLTVRVGDGEEEKINNFIKQNKCRNQKQRD